MATVNECRKALRLVATRLDGDGAAAARIRLDRAIACHITDLDVYFHGRLRDGAIADLADGNDPAAQIRLSVSSDDLLALVNGELGFASAWATGRVSVRASFGDLLKMRKLI